LEFDLDFSEEGYFVAMVFDFDASSFLQLIYRLVDPLDFAV